MSALLGVGIDENPVARVIQEYICHAAQTKVVSEPDNPTYFVYDIIATLLYAVPRLLILSVLRQRYCSCGGDPDAPLVVCTSSVVRAHFLSRR